MKKMNLVFSRLSAKSIFTLLLFFGLIIFTGQKASAQYVSSEVAKEVVYSYIQELPATPIMTESTYNASGQSSEKMASVGMKKSFARLFMVNLSDGGTVEESIQGAYLKYKDRVPSNKQQLLEKIKLEFISMLGS